MAVMSDARTFLRQDADVLAAFGERIGVDEIADGWDYPQAMIRQITTGTSYHQSGEGNALVLLQIDVFDDDRATLDTNAALIKARLSGHRGIMGAASYGRVFMTDVRTDRLQDQPRKYRKIMEAEIATENR